MRVARASHPDPELNPICPTEITVTCILHARTTMKGAISPIGLNLLELRSRFVARLQIIRRILKFRACQCKVPWLGPPVLSWLGIRPGWISQAGSLLHLSEA